MCLRVRWAATGGEEGNSPGEGMRGGLERSLLAVSKGCKRVITAETLMESQNR